MAEEADDSVVKYHRRLDRTPEKQFEKYPDGVKKLVSSMRGALENCRNKVEELKNDNDEKEKTIDGERSRRKEAEKRLRQLLVDPYGSPEVNSELRNRLPRASQADPLLDMDVAAESSEQSEAEGEFVRQSRASRHSAESPRRTKGDKRTARRVLNFQHPPTSPHSNRNHLDNKAEWDDSELDSEEEHAEHHQREPRSRHHRGKIKSQPPSSYSPKHSTFPPLHYQPYAPGVPGYPVGHYMPPVYAPFTLTPWSSVSSVSVAPTSHSPREGQATASRSGIPLSRSYPLLNGEQVDGLEAGAHLPEDFSEKVQLPTSTGFDVGSTVNPNSVPPQSFAAEDTTVQAAASSSQPQSSAARQPASPSRQNPTAQKSAIASELMSQSASSMASSHYGLPTTLPRECGAQFGVSERLRPPVPQAAVPAYSVPLLNAGGISPLTGASMHQTSVMEDEIGRLKEANRQLKEKLTLCTKEVEMLKLQILTETPKDGTLDSEAAQKFAELMSEVKAAEKRRQETLEARVIQAEQDKEQLIHDFENTLLRTNVERRSGRRLTMQDLSSSESETEDSDEEEEEEVKVTKAEHSTPSSVRRSSDAGRLEFLKDALKEVERRQRREVEIYQEELQVVMEQRDQALEKLQAERQRTQLQQLHMPSQREQMLMAKISVLQREKDRAENSARQLREEQVERNLYISLHKALFPDSALNDCEQADPADGKMKRKVIEDDDDNKVSVAMKEDNQLLEQLRQANQEKTFLQRRCEELEALCKQEKEDKNRLERLNGVLRKKLIAVSTPGSPTSQET